MPETVLKGVKNTAKAEQIAAALTGNSAVAMALKQADPDVVSAYPITPQTTIVEELANYAARDHLKGKFVNVESEHSAMSSAIGAAAAGARSVTATSSQGLALMWEMLYIAAGLRLPIIMPMANRALSAPINIHGDHSDAMGARDTGWIQLFSEDAQEAYDNTLMSFRVAEHEDVKLPCIVNLDGFIISHAIARLDIMSDEDAGAFIGESSPTYGMLTDDHVETVGAFDGLGGFYFEFKRQQDDALQKAKEVLLDVSNEFSALTGRSYGLFEEYMLEDAETAIVVMSSAGGTTRVAVDKLRAEGKKVGMLKLRMFRPFPADEIAVALGHCRAVAVLDRSHGLAGTGGPMGDEVKAAMYHLDDRPDCINYVYGLGGRDVTVENIESVYSDLDALDSATNSNTGFRYLNLRD